MKNTIEEANTFVLNNCKTTTDGVLEMMVKYANQFTPKEVSDEEIDEYIKANTVDDNRFYALRLGMKSIAKWMRDKMKGK